MISLGFNFKLPSQFPISKKIAAMPLAVSCFAFSPAFCPTQQQKPADSDFDSRW
jgi:hypothetical protein